MLRQRVRHCVAACRVVLRPQRRVAQAGAAPRTYKIACKADRRTLQSVGMRRSPTRACTATRD